MSVSVFIDDDKNIPSVENLNLIFLSEKDDSFTALRSLPVFLKQGNYRVKIAASNEVFWNSFTVQPWAESKKKGGNAVTYYRYDRGKQPLTIIPQVRDSISGKDLLPDSMILIREGKKWLKIEDIENLQTGEVIKILVKTPGYSDKIFS